LPRSSIDNSCRAILFPAGFEHGEWPNGVHAEIAERVFHRFEMAHMPGEIEYMRASANEAAHQRKIASIAFYDFDPLLDRFNIEIVRAARGIEVIDNGNGSAKPDQADGNITPNEAEPAGN
jgi:hypothetical protein